MNLPCRFWIVDHTLVDRFGHYLTYAQTVRQQALRSQITCNVIAHRDAIPQVCQQLDAVPALRMGHHTFLWAPLVRLLQNRTYFLTDKAVPHVASDQDALPDTGFLGWLRRMLLPTLHGLNIRWYAGHHKRDLVRCLPTDLGPEDVLFVPTADHRHVLAFSWWMQRFSPGHEPRVILLMRYNYLTPEYSQIASLIWVRRTFEKIERLAMGRRLELVTDSQRLAHEYQLFTKLPVKVLPIPHVPEQAAECSNLSRDEDAVNYVCLGDARQEKGFDLLAQAIVQLAQHHQLGAMRFHLQCPISNPVHETMRQWISILQKLNHPAITLHEKVFSTQAYQQQLQAADVVLLPYRKQVYQSRTSGPLVEALALGKPVITTRDTWLYDQVNKTQAGLCITDGDVKALADAMVQMRDQIGQWQAHAKAASSQWRAYHNPENFLKMLLD